MKGLRKITAAVVATIMILILVPTYALEEKSFAFIDDWDYVTNVENAGASIDDSEEAMGNASLKLWQKNVRGSEHIYVRLNIPANVEANKRYYFEFDVKTKNAKGVFVQFDGTTRSLDAAGVKSTDWRHFKLYFDSPTQKKMLVKLGATDYTEAVWFDNIKYYAEDNPEVNLLSQSDFENIEPTKDAPEEENEGAKINMDDYVLCYSTDRAIIIDGNDDEWEDIPNIMPVPITVHMDLMEHDDKEFSSNVRFTWDDKNFYFVVNVQDEIHKGLNTSQYWAADSIQFNLTYNTNNPGFEMGTSFGGNGEWHYQNRDDFTSAIHREGTETVYEVAVPWTSVVDGFIPSVLRVNVLTNNDNGSGRQEYDEITQGIGSGGKNPNYFKYFLMIKNVGDLLYAEYVPQQLEKREDALGKVFLRNISGVEQNAEISVDEIGFSENVIVKPDELIAVDIENKAKIVKDINFNINIKNKGEEVTLPYNTFVPYGAEEYSLLKTKLEGWIVEIKDLLHKCEEKGLITRYETAYYSMLARYNEIMNELAEKGDYKIMHMYEEDLTMIYEETKAALNSYLSGEKEPLKVPMYVTSDIKTDGMHLIAKTFDGERYEERPIFLTGFGHFDTALNDFEFFSNIGMNINENEQSYAGTITKNKPTAYPWDKGSMGGGTGICEESNEEAASGKWSVKFSHPDGQWGKSTWMNNVIKIEPNTTYEYGFKSKGSIKAEDRMYFSIHGMWGQDRIYFKSTGDWIENKGVYTTAPDQKTLEMNFVCNDTANMYIDDFYIRKAGTQKNLVENGDFELGGREMYEWEKELLEKHGCYVRWKGLENMKNALEEGSRNNVVVLLAANCHYMPEFIYENETVKKATDSTFAPWTVNNDYLPEMFSYNAKAIVSLAQNYENVYAMSIMNEPTAKSHFEGEWYSPDFRKYLEEVHGTIENLNATYGEGYNFKSFDEINVPKGVENTPLFADYRMFNDKQLTKFMGDYAAKVREEYPDILYGTKIMMSLSHNHDGYLLQGTNMEYLEDVFDINGSDSFSQHNTTPVSLKMAWYDYLASINDTPIACWEGHVTGDSSVVTDDSTLEHKFGADIWNGALHGKTSSVMWLWDGTEEFVRFANTDMAYRPDCLYRIVKSNFDINRLANELVAFHKNADAIGIRYSRMSGGYNSNYGIDMQEAYEELVNTGYKAYFVTEDNMEDMHNLDTLVIFGSANVTEEYLDNMKKFAENGGKIILIGDYDGFYDMYNKPHNKDTVDYVMSKVVHLSDEKELSDKINEIKPAKIRLVDAKTGETLNNRVEWMYTEYNGKYLVDICNYDPYNDVDVNVIMDGTEVQQYKELRSMEDMSGAITLKAQQPILIQIDK